MTTWLIAALAYGAVMTFLFLVAACGASHESNRARRLMSQLITERRKTNDLRKHVLDVTNPHREGAAAHGQ